MGIGANLPGWVLDQNDGESLIVLNVARVRRSVDSGVSQRVYARGQQRSIRGFATRSSLMLTLGFIEIAEQLWLEARVGQLVTLRDINGGSIQVIVGDLTWLDDPSLDDTTVYNVPLELIYARESN